MSAKVYSDASGFPGGVEGGEPVVELSPFVEQSFAARRVAVHHGVAQQRVDFAQTVSCYQADADGRACGRCDACRLRAEGFRAAGVPDPTRYRDAST